MTSLLSILLIKVINSENQQKVINNLTTNDFSDPFTGFILDKINYFSTNFSISNIPEIKDISVDLSSIPNSFKIDPLTLVSYKDILTSAINSTYYYISNISSPQVVKVYMFCCCIVIVTAVTVKTFYFIHNVYLSILAPFSYVNQMINTTIDTSKQVVLYTADTSKQVVLYTADTFKIGFIKTGQFLTDMSKIAFKVIFNTKQWLMDLYYNSIIKSTQLYYGTNAYFEDSAYYTVNRRFIKNLNNNVSLRLNSSEQRLIDYNRFNDYVSAVLEAKITNSDLPLDIAYQYYMYTDYLIRCNLNGLFPIKRITSVIENEKINSISSELIKSINNVRYDHLIDILDTSLLNNQNYLTDDAKTIYDPYGNRFILEDDPLNRTEIPFPHLRSTDIVLRSANDVYNDAYQISVSNFWGIKNYEQVLRSNVTQIDFNTILMDSSNYLKSVNNIRIKDSLAMTLKDHIADMSQYTHAQILSRRILDNYHLWLYNDHVTSSMIKRAQVLEYTRSLKDVRFSNPLLSITDQVTNYYVPGSFGKGFLTSLITQTNLF